MALRERNRVKLITGSGGGTLVADADESFLVKDIFDVPTTNETYLSVLVAGVMIAKYRTKGLAGNHLPFPCVKTAQIYEHLAGTIIAQLRAAGRAIAGLPPRPHGDGLAEWQANRFDLAIPVASGQTLTVSRYAEAGNVCLLYDAYDAGDLTPDMPNGTQGKIQRYLHYGTNAASAADGACAVATSAIWTGGDSWPFGGGSVAEKNVFRLLAIAGCPLGKGASAANKGYTTHLQLIHRNNILFDEDAQGLPFKGDTSALSAVSYVSYGSVVGVGKAENPTSPFVLDPPLEFAEGDRLSTNVVIAGYASGGPGAAELDLAYALEHEYLA